MLHQSRQKSMTKGSVLLGIIRWISDIQTVISPLLKRNRHLHNLPTCQEQTIRLTAQAVLCQVVYLVGQRVLRPVSPPLLLCNRTTC